MPTALIDGHELNYVAGSGSPLVLLTGQSTGPAGREGLLHALSRHYRVIRYEQRRMATHDRHAPAASIENFAADVVSLLDAIEIRRAHLVCHSTGCGLGLSIAARWPDRVAALVLAAPWTHADEHLTAVQELRKAAAAALSPEQYARFNAMLLFPPEYRRAHFAAFAQAAAQAKPQDAAVIAARLDAILAFDARPLWPAIRCPTLVMASSDDQVMPRWFAADTARAIPGALLIEFDSGGHAFPETRTREFVAAVHRFLHRKPVC